VGSNPTEVAAADFNRDGKLDLAVSNYGSETISILLGNGDGTFNSHVDYAAENGPGGVNVADVTDGYQNNRSLLSSLHTTRQTATEGIMFVKRSPFLLAAISNVNCVRGMPVNRSGNTAAQRRLRG
jgi:hypothetical protein